MNKPIRNVYCYDKEDLVVPTTCACCTRCYKYVQSKNGRKNGGCPFGGPFSGYEREVKEHVG